MENKFTYVLLAALLFLATAATVFYSTGGIAYMYEPNLKLTGTVIRFTLTGLIWVVATWFSLRSMGASISYLLVASVVLIGAVAAAIGTASCYLDACPPMSELLAFTTLGLPLLILLLAPTLSGPTATKLPFGLLLLSLAYAVPLLFVNPLAAALPYAAAYLVVLALSRLAPLDNGGHWLFLLPALSLSLLGGGGVLLAALVAFVWPTGFAQAWNAPLATAWVTLALLGPSLLAMGIGLVMLELRTRGEGS
ncbi:hypothetical protein [Oceanithermus desulfurans]|uniref:Uncharacterized protein n=2 Tax=Oceanithermus desulfurans TaxID=227924 RepID=A0A511RL82_9DEIN|nr:hypothetical protein [Oceanithermus desulfurans]MBB6030009.1 hypothetical protein [Oceanithermus desulfurans]GEM90423.1 hypothetical protein ODE01S_18570 [Oceanithermus desulfurans NBRC 100063]